MARSSTRSRSKSIMMIYWDSDFDDLSLHGIIHFSLLSVVGIKDNGKRLKILSAPLFHGSFGLPACRYNVCHNVMKGLSSLIDTHIYVERSRNILRNYVVALLLKTTHNSPAKKIPLWNSLVHFSARLDTQHYTTRFLQLLLACKHTCSTPAAIFEINSGTDSKCMFRGS